uniref:DDE-1 domain-containing protein n=1 Tax=Cacopsylla melanoneura TaxID=428564 RepID=A0A8D8RDV2_9HEMI
MEILHTWFTNPKICGRLGQKRPPGCRYNRSISGWLDSQSFDDWFHSLVLPHLKRQDRLKVLIEDNLSSHLNVNNIETCRTNNIKFICLPPNPTHLTQPLDLAYFRPMKESCGRKFIWHRR